MVAMPAAEVFHVLWVVADREDPRVDAGVQRLDAPVEHLGKAGLIRDAHDREAGVLEQLRRAAGREELDAQAVELAGEGDDALLVEDADQRAADGGAHRFAP